MVDSVVPQRNFSPVGVTATIGVLVALVLGYGWWSTGQNIAALDKRTAKLEGTSGPSAADVQKLQQEQTDLGKKVDAITMPDVSGLSAEIATLKSSVGDLTTQLADSPKKLAALETRVAAIEAKAPAAPADLTQLSADVADVKTGLATLKTQIGDFAPATISALTTQVSDLAAKIPVAVTDDNSQLATQVAALGGQIDTLRTQLGDLSADKLTTLQSNLDGLGSKVAAIDLGPVTADLGAVKTQVAGLSSSIAAAASKTDLTALQARLDEMAKSVQPAADITPLSGDIEALKSRVAMLEASGSTDSTAVTALKTQLDGLNARVGAVESTSPAADVATLKTGLADLSTQIGTLAKASDVASLQAAVRELQLKPAVAPTRPKVLAQIYFNRGSYKLADADTQTLTDLAKDLMANPREVAIMGFSDTQGPVEFNRTLSVRRASAVRKALIGMGVDTSLVTAITGLGEDGPPVTTSDDTPEQANRTVLVLANN